MSAPAPRPAGRASHYVDAAALAALVLEHRRTGAVPDGLARALLAIAGGVWDRYRFTPDRDDFVQDVVLHLLGRPLEKADPEKPLFNFFTTCAVRFAMKLRDKQLGDRRRFETYAAELVEAGRQIPGRE